MSKNRKRRQLTNKRKSFIIVNSFLALFLVLGIGYSSLSSILNIFGEVTVSKYDSTLYGVLEKNAKTGVYAKEYTGEHHDSFTEDPNRKIYHWYASNDTNGTAIQDKNNVIFANHCWQMIRTTDTGGVKMIYNGEVEDGKCLNTRGTHVGYLVYNDRYMRPTYYYGTSYTYDKENNKFTLAGNITTGQIKTGEYTCMATSEPSTCTTIFYVDKLTNGSNYSVLALNNNSNYSNFGTVHFNLSSDSLSYVGYMYNIVYQNHAKAMTNTEKILSSSKLETSYWYANDAVWGNPTADNYNLVNPYQITSTSGYPNLVGEYTFGNTTQTYTNTTVQYISAVDDENMYCIELTDTGNHTLAEFNYTYTYGGSYTDNGDGTYTINNPTTINRIDWYTSYSNVGSGKYVCKNAINNTCSELWYTTSTSNTSMDYIEVANNYKYAKGFTWDGSKYILDNDTQVSFWNANNSSNISSLNNAHYTCWNNSGECTTLSYIYQVYNSKFYYIDLTNGKSAEDAKNEMLYDDNVNTNNSRIKTGVEAWFEKYMLDYSDYLEDTIFCNDRSQKNSGTNGWNPNGGNVNSYLDFYRTSDLICINNNDKFSTLNNKAKLKYKVGLMSASEMNLLGDSSVRKTATAYYLGSPSHYYIDNVSVFRVYNSGAINRDSLTWYGHGMRPAISLKPGTTYSSGDGSMANPYIVDTN